MQTTQPKNANGTWRTAMFIGALLTGLSVVFGTLSSGVDSIFWLPALLTFSLVSAVAPKVVSTAIDGGPLLLSWLAATFGFWTLVAALVLRLQHANLGARRPLLTGVVAGSSLTAVYLLTLPELSTLPLWWLFWSSLVAFLLFIVSRVRRRLGIP